MLTAAIRDVSERQKYIINCIDIVCLKITVIVGLYSYYRMIVDQTFCKAKKGNILKFTWRVKSKYIFQIKRILGQQLPTF